MKTTILFVVIVLSILAVNSQDKWEPLTPDETYFTYTRCMEDNFANDYTLVSKWLHLELAPDAKTDCFVKCVLERFELYDPKTKAFTPSYIVPLQEKYSKHTKVTGEEATAVRDAFSSASVAANDCKSVSDAFMPILAAHPDAVKKILLADRETVKAIIADDKTLKKKGESIFRFCEKKWFADGSDELCKKRHGQIPDFADLPKYQECILKGLRYIDRNGKPDVAEVKRDFHEIGVTDKDAEIDEMFAKCGSDPPSFYKCGWGTTGDFKKKWMESVDYHEIRSLNYAYKLDPATPAYNAADVKAKVVELDILAGCPPSP